MTEIIDISAKDCLPFSHQDHPGFEEAIRGLLKAESGMTLLSLDSKREKEEEHHLTKFDYQSGKWLAGRYVGEALISTSQGKFRFRIEPRFGFMFLFRLLEEVLQLKFSKSLSSFERQLSDQNLIKQLIAFIWVQKLANANKHGLPKNKKQVRHRGIGVKGRINIRKLLQPYYETKELISESIQKDIDEIIGQILLQAYRILNKDYGLAHFVLPESVQEAIHELNRGIQIHQYISDHQYSAIRFKEIYLPFEPLVDLSWDIIKAKRLANKQEEKKKMGEAFFLDIAELWEMYIRSLLKKRLSRDGWRVYTETWTTYPKHFFRRKLIPDIIIKREGQFMIWDAKYKLMRGSGLDVDRLDFFQIHTYLQYYLGSEKKVVGGGLIYPLKNILLDGRQYSKQLLNEAGLDIAFGVDGIDLSYLEDWQGSRQEAYEILRKKEREFIDRLLKFAKIIDY